MRTSQFGRTQKRRMRIGFVAVGLGILSCLLILHMLRLHSVADEAHAASRDRALQQLKILDGNGAFGDDNDQAVTDRKGGGRAAAAEVPPSTRGGASSAVARQQRADRSTTQPSGDGSASSTTASHHSPSSPPHPFVLDMYAAPKALAACPIPELRPEKHAAAMGWGERKVFPKCAKVLKFSELHEHGLTADVLFKSDACKATGVVWELAEMRDADFSRMQTTYDAEERQTMLRDRFLLEVAMEMGVVPQFVQNVIQPDRTTGSATGIVHPYVVAKCGKEMELYVRAPRPDASRERYNKLAGKSDAEVRAAADEATKAAGGLKNIMHIMFDSTSIYAQRRGAKKISKFLETLNNDPSSPSYVFPFFHHHSVSCCSPGNQIPMYSGNMNGEGDPFINAEPYRDSRDWVWNIATERGFRTFWALDNCPDKSARDFHAYPTVDSRVVAPVCMAGVLLSHKELACVGGKTIDEMVLEGLESFWAHHDGERKFGMAHFISPHEPTEKLLIELDDLVERYFEHLEHSGALNDTAIILWSDHGINFGKYASSPEGEIEKLFPFANVVLPRRFSEASGFVPQLRHNMHRLTTHYDLYELTRRLLYYPAAPPPFAHDKSNPPLPSPAQSHIMASFRKPITPIDVSVANISDDRDCMAANIPVEFCTCLPWAAGPPANQTSFAELAMDAHHRVLAPYGDVCHTPQLVEVLSFEIQRWPANYQPKGKESAKRMWAKPDRDMVRLTYRTAPPAEGTFIAVFSVPQMGGAAELARMDRLDAMGPTCGLVEKVAEHMCVCK